MNPRPEEQDTGPSTLNQIIAALGSAVPGGSTVLDALGSQGIGGGSAQHQRRERHKPITQPISEAAGAGTDFLTNTFLPGMGAVGGAVNQGIQSLTTPNALRDTLNPNAAINENPGVQLPVVTPGEVVGQGGPAAPTTPATSTQSSLFNQETGNVILPQHMQDKLATMNPQAAASHEKKWRMGATNALNKGNGVGHLMRMGYSKEDAISLNDKWQQGGARHSGLGHSAQAGRAGMGNVHQQPQPQGQAAGQQGPSRSRSEIDSALRRRPGAANVPHVPGQSRVDDLLNS
jgi:hypothetical protein